MTSYDMEYVASKIQENQEDERRGHMIGLIISQDVEELREYVEDWLAFEDLGHCDARDLVHLWDILREDNLILQFEEHLEEML